MQAECEDSRRLICARTIEEISEIAECQRRYEDIIWHRNFAGNELDPVVVFVCDLGCRMRCLGPGWLWYLPHGGLDFVCGCIRQTILGAHSTKRINILVLTLDSEKSGV